MKTEDGTS